MATVFEGASDENGSRVQRPFSFSNTTTPQLTSPVTEDETVRVSKTEIELSCISTRYEKQRNVPLSRLFARLKGLGFTNAESLRECFAAIREEKKFDRIMENDVVYQVNCILDGVESILDLTEDIVSNLVGLDAGRIPIEKFKVTLSDFTIWAADNEIRGVEFDGTLQRLIIKADGGPMHEIPSGAFIAWLLQLSTHLNHQVDPQSTVKYFWAGGTRYTLSKKHRFSADGSIKRSDKHFPMVIFELGISQSLGDLFDKALKWLSGSNGQVSMVILANITEHISNSMKGQDCSWGLTDNQVLQRSNDELISHIFQWHKDTNTPILGQFTAEIFICSAEIPRPKGPCWTWKFELANDGQTKFLREVESGRFVNRNPFLNPNFQVVLDGVTADLPVEAFQEAIKDCIVDSEFYRVETQLENKQRHLKAAIADRERREDEKSTRDTQRRERDVRAGRRQSRP